MSLPVYPLVQPFFHGESSTWSYVVADVGSGRAAVIDPVLDFDPRSARTSTHSVDSLIAWVRENAFAIDWILETHAHADNLSAAQHVKQQLGGRIGISAGICITQKMFAPIFGLEDAFACDGSQFDRLFADGESFPVSDIDAQVIAVPGHTADAVAYLHGDALFVGDSLFMPDAGSARCDTHLRVGIEEQEFVRLRRERDASLAVPALLLPAIQVNIHAGELPPTADNGVCYLKLLLDTL